jgi:hypothetical protein
MLTENRPQPCPSCGHTMEQKFCSYCGEKRVNRHDFSLKHFIEEAVEGITHFDNKFFRTIKILITKPGKLAEDFSNGIRLRYMRPLQLYIVCNLIFFLAVIFWTPFSQPLYSYWNYQPYTLLGSKDVVKDKVAEEIEAFKKNYDKSGTITVALTDKYFYSAVEQKFNKSIKSQSKVFLIILIPTYAFLFMIFFRRKRFIGEHFILATHFMAALLVYFLFAAYLINIPVNYFLGENNEITSILSMAVIFLYLAIAFKRFYKTSTWRSTFGALAVGSLTFVVWTLYRMLLFYNIMFWM